MTADRKEIPVFRSVLFASCLAFSACGVETAGRDGTDPTAGVEEAGLASGFKKVKFDFTLTSQVTPTADPCVVRVFESGTATSALMGNFTWSSDAVSSFCSRGQGKGDNMAVFTFVKANGDRIYGTYRTLLELDQNQALHWVGYWEFSGGTGAFANIRGAGTIPSGGIPSIVSSDPFTCIFNGAVKI